MDRKFTKPMLSRNFESICARNDLDWQKFCICNPTHSNGGLHDAGRHISFASTCYTRKQCWPIHDRSHQTL